MTSKIKPEFWWCVWSPYTETFMTASARKCKEDSVDAYLDDNHGTWEQNRKDGYRCIRVRVVPVIAKRRGK